MSMPAGFRRHLVGKTLINVFIVISLENTLRFVDKVVNHTDVFVNQRIECYLNNTINLRPLTPHIMPCYTHKMTIVWWPCDVTSPSVYKRLTCLLSKKVNNWIWRDVLSVTQKNANLLVDLKKTQSTLQKVLKHPETLTPRNVSFSNSSRNNSNIIINSNDK